LVVWLAAGGAATGSANPSRPRSGQPCTEDSAMNKTNPPIAIALRTAAETAALK
jgi:hypothetical protein